MLPWAVMVLQTWLELKEVWQHFWGEMLTQNWWMCTALHTGLSWLSETFWRKVKSMISWWLCSLDCSIFTPSIIRTRKVCRGALRQYGMDFFLRKINGTRWLAHLSRGIKSLLRTYLAYEAHLSTLSHSNPKAEGYLKMLLSKDLVCFTLFLQVSSSVFGVWKCNLLSSCQFWGEFFFYLVVIWIW